MKNAIVAGADVGGSHITVGLVDMNTRKIIENTKKRREINSNRSADEIISSWSAVINESLKTAVFKASKLGVAMPGPFDYENGISYIRDQNKYDALYGLNVKEKLAQKLGLRIGDITFTNDAVCFLQGEVFGGAGNGFNRVIGLTLGTGLGSARLLGEEASDADLWCSAFKGGIAEDYLSTRWFIKKYKELSGQDIKGVKEMISNGNENNLAQEVFDEFGRNLADFLIPHIKGEKFQLLILGGNISLAFPYFSKAVKQSLNQAQLDIEIRTTKLGENASLMGAAKAHYIPTGAFKLI